MITQAKSLVIKIGTGVLTQGLGEIYVEHIHKLAKQITALHRQGVSVFIVSSGAIGLGMGQLGLTKRPTHLADLQACAALGQPILIETWQNAFKAHEIKVAQVLLTREDVEAHHRHVALSQTLEKLASCGVIPIINENDSVSADEIAFGDNDILSALTASLVKADLLVILSTIKGLLDLEGSGALIPTVKEITPDIEQLAQDTQSATSVGGMRSKVEAAKIATAAGCGVLIGDGRVEDGLSLLMSGKQDGTFFVPQAPSRSAQKR